MATEVRAKGLRLQKRKKEVGGVGHWYTQAKVEMSQISEYTMAIR